MAACRRQPHRACRALHRARPRCDHHPGTRSRDPRHATRTAAAAGSPPI